MAHSSSQNTVPKRPPLARTIIDMKDRAPTAFHPFITFEFEPTSSVRARESGNGRGRRTSAASSGVPINHFDPEGVEHLRSRFSLASEYSSSKDESKIEKIHSSTGPEDEEPLHLAELKIHSKQPQEDPPKSQQVTGDSVTVSSLNPTGLYVHKRLTPFDLETALRETIKQHSTRNGSHRSLGVGFKDLTVFAADRSLSSQAAYQPTVWSSLNPVEWAKQLLRTRNRSLKRVICGFEGVVDPGEMLLVLGRPSSGCSTLLNALANQTKGFVHVLGERQYDALTPRDVGGLHRGDVLYFPEGHTHISSLTVQQTISSAASLRKSDNRLASGDIDQLTTTLLTIFGLRQVKDTLMGVDDNQVSQAEKRRVSICEALAAGVLVCCWDNISQGLDASAALEFVRALRIATDLSAMTTIVTLGQVGEKVYQLFDKVCVVGEGRMYYYGRANAARDFFVDLGYNPLRRQTTPEFLISVTDPLGRMQNPKRPFSTPRTPEEFARAFHRSPMGRENRLEIAKYWQENVGYGTLTRKRFGNATDKQVQHAGRNRFGLHSWTRQLFTMALREHRMLRNTWASMIIQILLPAFQGAVSGLIYWQAPDSTASSPLRNGIFLVITILSVLSTMVESLELGLHRAIDLQCYRVGLCRPSTEAVAIVLLDIPMTFLCQSIVAAIIYMMAGLRQSTDHFLTFLLFVVSIALTVKLFFRSLALLVTEKTVRYAIAGPMVVLSLLHSGFADVMSPTSRLLRWMIWLNPVRYAFEGFMVNEYHNREMPCTIFIPQGIGYDDISPLNQVCLAVGSTTGDTSVNGDRYLEVAYGYAYNNIWINLGFVFVFGVTFLGCFLLISEWKTPDFARSFVLFKRASRECTAVGDKPDLYRHIRRFHQALDGERDSERFEVPLNDVFAWKNLQVSAPHRKGQKVLLDGISGYVAPRKLCALVGGSGVGKTTLLNVLTGRLRDGTAIGDIHLNGLPLPPDFRSQIGFCQQTDAHYAKQTVREALLFSADLRQPATVPRQDNEEYVEACLKMCGLETYADAIVSTLNVEYRRRTTIGVELASQPRLLLFLDEPTRGLDPQAALSIIALLRDLANHGQAILCAVNQPSSEMLEHFDQALILHKGGKMVYFGDIGHDSETMIRYFERNGARSCGTKENPAEWVMDIISADDYAYIPVDWHGKWLRSPEVARLRREIDEFRKEHQRKPVPEKGHTKPRLSRRWYCQTRILLKRDWMTCWRSPQYILAKFSFNLLSGLFIGLKLFGSDNSLQGTRSKIFALSMLTIVCIPVAGPLQRFFMDAWCVFEVRERHSRMYTWTAFLVSHLLMELLWNVLFSILFFSAWYWAAGFDTGRVAYSLLMIGFIYPFYYTTFALALGSLSPSSGIFSMFFYTFSSLAMLFDGMTIRPSEDFHWWKWLHRASPFTYLLEGIIGQVLGHQQIECSPTEFSRVVPPSGETCIKYLSTFISSSGGYVNNPHGSQLCEYCPARTTDELLASRYGISSERHWRDLWIMVAACLLNLLLLFALTYVFRIRRGQLFRFGSRNFN